MKEKPEQTAIIKTINGDFTVSYLNSRDFINSIRSSIERKTLYEFTEGATRTLINSNNIVSIELASESLAFISPFTPQQSAEQLRELQLKMQPDILKFEAKAAAMQELKDKEDNARAKQFESIYPQIKEQKDKDKKKGETP